MINQTKRPNEIVLVKDGPVPEAIQEVIDAANANSRILSKFNLIQMWDSDLH